jgi:predicted P-loop ATPase
METLKKAPIWLVWKSEEVKSPGSDKQLNKRFTKVPYQINGKHASTVDPTTWSTFADAEAASKNFSGIGFTISKHTPLLCIDLDHCLNEEGKISRDDFHIIVEAADTYTEISPSGDGLHIILELESHFSLVSNKKVNEDGTAFECYTEGRYFTYTGKPFGAEVPVRKVSPEVADELLRMVGYPWGKTEQKPKEKIDAATINLDLTDSVVLDKMFSSKGGTKIQKLYNGDTSQYNNDHSAADSALCTHLAFWTQKNAEQMERIWVGSPLGQRKKTQDPKNRENYVVRTITNACEKCEKVYSPATLIQEEATVEPELEKIIKYSTNSKGIPFVNAHNVMQILEADSSLNKSFRFNEFSHEHESNVRTGREFTPLQKDDIVYTMIYIQKTYTFFEKVPVTTVQEAITAVALKNPVNPPVDLIKSVQWDGESRIEHWLFEVFGVEDTIVHRAIASNWLKGLINRVISPGCKFDTVLVLEGAQGIGKSSALRMLGDPWYAETTMDIDTKDFQLILTQNIIVEFSEGASLSRSASAAMKQKITDQEDNFRKPYDRTSQKYPRHCVFAMTTNEQQYLKDHTGNRRWLPVGLPEQDANLEWLKENRLQLFAEAYHRVYTLKEKTYEFPKEELEALQSSRLEEDPWIGKIVSWYFDELTDFQREEGITATQAYEDGIHAGNSISRDIRPGETHRIASIMTNFLALEKRRNVVNNIRAYRYFATTITDKLNKERNEDLTPTELQKKSAHQAFNSWDTADSRVMDSLDQLEEIPLPTEQGEEDEQEFNKN